MKIMSLTWVLLLLTVVGFSSCQPLHRSTRFDQWDSFFIEGSIHATAREKLELKIRTWDNPKGLSEKFYITHLTFSLEDAALLSYERFDMPDSMSMYNFADESFLYKNYSSEQGDFFITYNFRTRKYTQKDGIVKKLNSSPLFHIEIDRDKNACIYRGDSMITVLPSNHGRDPRTTIAYLPEKKMVVYMDFHVSKAAQYEQFDEPSICRIYECMIGDTCPTPTYEFKFAEGGVRPSYHPRKNDSPLIIFFSTHGFTNMVFNGNKLIECRSMLFYFPSSIYNDNIFYDLGQWPRTYSMKTNEFIRHYELYASFWGTLKTDPINSTEKSENCKPLDFLSRDFEDEHTGNWKQIYY